VHGEAFHEEFVVVVVMGAAIVCFVEGGHHGLFGVPGKLDGVLIEVVGGVEEGLAGVALLGFEDEAEEVGGGGGFPGEGEEEGEGGVGGDGEGVFGVEGGVGEGEEGGAVEGGEGEGADGGGELKGEEGGDGGGGGGGERLGKGGVGVVVASGEGGDEEPGDGQKGGQDEGAEEWAAVHGWWRDDGMLGVGGG